MEEAKGGNNQNSVGQNAAAGAEKVANAIKSGQQKISNAKEKYKDEPIENVFKFVKCVQTLSAVILISSGWGRFFSIQSYRHFTGFMLTLYFVIFAGVFIAMEFTWFKTRARMYFYFLNFNIGKALVYFWLGLLCFGIGSEATFFDIIAGVYFILLGILFIIMTGMYATREKDYILKLISDMEVEIKQAEQEADKQFEENQRNNRVPADQRI